MARELFDNASVDRSIFSLEALCEQGRYEARIWREKTPVERLQQLELLRQLNDNYDPDTSRLSRVHFSLEQTQRQIRHRWRPDVNSSPTSDRALAQSIWTMSNI